MAEVGGDQGGGGKHDKRGKKSTPRVDMTPMVDLGFLLLTFFVLTTTFSKPQAMEINMPVPMEDKSQRTQLPADRTINLLLSENNEVFWYMGVIKDPKNPPECTRTNFSSDGIRKVLLEKNRVVFLKIQELEKQLNEKKIEKDEYKKLAIEAKKDKRGLIVLIKPDQKAKYRNVVDMLDEMEITNIGKYALVDILASEVKLIEETKAKLTGN